MNIKRGLNRLFVVSAIGWYIVAGAILWPKWQAALNAKHADWTALRMGTTIAPGWTLLDEPSKSAPQVFPSAKSSSATPPTPDEILAALPPERPIKQSFIFLLIPPATYLFAAVLVWVVRGFYADPA